LQNTEVEFRKTSMPSGLKRYYGAHHLHFITCSCHHRLPFLNTAPARDLFLAILEETRQKYQFQVAGYVVMPEHIHLLLSEPKTGTLSTVLQVVKQRSSRKMRETLSNDEPKQFWQTRFYDFNVFTRAKQLEKLQYCI
jgi:putative transposase